MEKAAEGIDKQYVAWMRAKPEEVLKLFYHFVNRQDVLRGLAFTYWEQYFVNLYQFVIFATGFLVSLVFAINRGHWDWIVVFPTLFALLTLGYGLSTHFWLRKKLFDLPVQQIAEVKASSWDELKTQLKARFGGIIV
jgi:ABC-type microcin C transport system permease subunit YejB